MAVVQPYYLLEMFHRDPEACRRTQKSAKILKDIEKMLQLLKKA